MLAQFSDVCCASFPAEFLPALAEVRASPGIVTLHQGDRVWVRWESADDRILKRLLPIPSVTLYQWREGRWYRFGSALPVFDVPEEDCHRPLHDVLFPAAVVPVPKPAGTFPTRTVELTLVQDDVPRPATALLASTDDLLTWADSVPTDRLEKLQAARQGQRVLVLGRRLPVLASAQRLWGQRVLKPLGFRLEPDLPESTIRNALEIKEEELLLATEDGVQIVSAEVLQPLDRTALRLACLRTVREAGP
jgi:hypothetical protein